MNGYRYLYKTLIQLYFSKADRFLSDEVKLIKLKLCNFDEIREEHSQAIIITNTIKSCQSFVTRETYIL